MQHSDSKMSNRGYGYMGSRKAETRGTWDGSSENVPTDSSSLKEEESGTSISDQLTKISEQLSKVKVGSLEGTIETAETSGYPAEYTAYYTVNYVAADIIEDITTCHLSNACIMIMRDLDIVSGDLVVVEVRSQFLSYQSAVQAQMKVNEAACKESKEKAAHDLALEREVVEIGPEEVGKPPEKVLVAPILPALAASAAEVLPGLVGAVTEIATLFRNNYTITGKVLTCNEEALFSAVAGRLNKDGTRAYILDFYPLLLHGNQYTGHASIGGGKPGGTGGKKEPSHDPGGKGKTSAATNPGAPGGKDLDPGIMTLFSDLLGYFLKLVKSLMYLATFIARKTKDLEKKQNELQGLKNTSEEKDKEIRKKIAICEKEISHITDLLEIANSAVKSSEALIVELRAFLKAVTTHETGQTHSSLARAVLRERIYKMGITHFLSLKILSQGGEFIVRRRLVLPGTVTYTGGSVIRYVLAELDGAILASDSIPALCSCTYHLSGYWNTLIERVHSRFIDKGPRDAEFYNHIPGTGGR